MSEVMEADLIVMTLDNKEDGPLIGGKRHHFLPEVSSSPSSLSSASPSAHGGLLSHLIERVEEGFHSLQHAAAHAPSSATNATTATMTKASTTSAPTAEQQQNKDNDLWASNFP